MKIEVSGARPRFQFHWPTGVEEYGPVIEVVISDRQFVGHVKLFVAYGFREAFGKSRRRILVFRNEADVLAEFTGVDDWVQSKRVATFLRRDGTKKYLRLGEPIPPRYAQFDVTESTSVITGRYAPRCFAALVDESDVETLVAVATAREEGETAVRAEEPAGSKPAIKTGAVPSGEDFGAQEAVVQALLNYRARQNSGSPFTKSADADKFLRQNLFAFLMAASIDRGARAEAVWETPFLLCKKLGHFDPGILANSAVDQVETTLRSLSRRPRFPRQAAQTIISLAKLITDEFLGDVAGIWHGRQPHEVTRTLEKIWGVGPGIAHMVVRILVDEYGYDPGPEGLRQIDVKPDVQVRRVFYRTGITPDKNENTSVHVARQLHPEFPGLLDWPTWEIGRSWCHERNPKCNECPLHGVCLKRDL
jgi:endonuclease III